jgi:molybdate transport system ATP-binding protein
VDIEKKFRDFNLNIKFNVENNIIGLLGASGSGKSMTLKMIAGLENPDNGLIKINEKVVFDSKEKINTESRERKTGFLFQNYALFPNMNVEQNIGFALNKMKKDKKDKIIKDKINQVKLKGLEKRFPNQLSGGQQQRVALARALAIEPEVLMLDEPFSALDEHLRNQMVNQLMEILDSYKGITILVSHNMEEIYRICNKMVVLDSGKVEATGSKENLFIKPPTVVTAKLTGCKNISKANYISKNEILAKEWGIKLKVNEICTKDISHIGIRANHIRIIKDKDKVDNEKDNVIKCWVNYINEAPFRVSIYLNIDKRCFKSDHYDLQIEVSKDFLNGIDYLNKPLYISLSPEKLVVFNK